MLSCRELLRRSQEPLDGEPLAQFKVSANGWEQTLVGEPPSILQIAEINRLAAASMLWAKVLLALLSCDAICDES
jgi:hypothetical protein